MPAMQPLSDRELLERFRERHGDAGSVHDIARMPEAEFVAMFSAELERGQSQARRIHQMARCVSETTALVWANLRDLAVPHLRPTLFNNVAQSFLEHAASIPGYQALFGDLSVLDCDDARSVFGPAAYFVDLMRFVEQHIDSSKVRAVHALPYRRPDLSRLQLDAHNTYGLVQEIDLTIEALSSLAASTGASVDEVLRGGRYPWGLPFDEPLERLRTDLGSIGVDLTAVADVFAEDGDALAAKGAAERIRVREALGLSPAECDLLVAPAPSPAAVARSFGGAGAAAMTSVDLFLDRTGLSRAELTELVAGAYDDAEVAAGLARRRFINDVADGLGALDIEVDGSDPQRPLETLVNLSPAKLDRIERFVRLSRRLGWSFIDLDAALTSQHAGDSGDVVLSFDGSNDHAEVEDASGLALDSMTIECWVRPTAHRINPVVAKGDAGPGQATTDWLVWIDQDGRLAFRAGTAGYSRSRRAIPTETFSHVAVTVAGGANPTVGLAINGEPEPVWRVEARQESLDAALPAAVGTAGTRLLIGKSFGGDVFAGAIADLRVWEGVRDAGTIAARRFQRLSGLERDLVGYWPLVRERWGRLSDRTPHANHAKAGGAGFVTQPRWAAHDLVLDALPPQVPALLSFDGDEDLLAASDLGTLADATFTVELLVELGTAGAAPLARWESDAGALHLRTDTRRRLVLESGSVSVVGTTPLVTDVLTHVAAIVTPAAVTFVVDGVLDTTQPNPGIRLAEGPLRMLVGHDGATAFFAGRLGELRVWDRALTVADIDRGRHQPSAHAAPGLVGSWEMSPDDDDQVRDRSFNVHHLWIGGEPATYRPEAITAGPILPASPIANEAGLLRLDGANDFITLAGHHAALGRFDRATLGLWFKPADLAAPEPQMLFSQGDAEAGLSMYLASGAVHVVAWNADLGGTNVAEYAASSGTLEAVWHHVAVTIQDGPLSSDPACAALDQTEIVVYVDGAEVQRHTTPARLPLSPVGPTYLGGLGHPATTRVAGDFVVSDGPARSFYAGHLADLQIWNRVLSPDERFRVRVAAPDTADESLVAYLPMDDGSGHSVHDPRPAARLAGVLSRDDIALGATDVAVGEGDAFVHATVAGALDWADYDVTGRLRLGDGTTGAGITFLSRHPDGHDQCYALVVDQLGGSFHLTSRPRDLEALEGELDTGVVPAAAAWYRFAIRVADIDDATRIEARVWPEGEQEPRNPSARASDAGSYRLTSGSVGLWRRGTGGFDVDDIVVTPHTPDDAVPWVDESFEGAWPSDPGHVPDGWGATHVISATGAAADLFTIHDRDGVLALGSSADRPVDEELTTRHIADGADQWTDYVYTGRFWLGAGGAALGFTVLAADATTAYRIRRLPHRPTLQLDTRALEHGLEGTIDSGYDPAPGAWHRFFIEVENAGTHTSIRARFWAEGDPEPDGFTIDATDASEDRLSHGTVGLWTLAGGERLVDDLLVYPRSLPGRAGEPPRFAEDFESYAEGEHPADWSDTGVNSDDEPTELFVVSQEAGSKVLRTAATARNAHTHYSGADTLDWTNYVFTGRMLVSAESTGLGVTFLSRYPEIWFASRRDADAWRQGAMQRPHNRYYRLGRSPKIATFRLWAHPDRNDKGGQRDYKNWPLRLEGTTDSGVECELGSWYRFRIQVEDTGTETRILGKLWLDGSDEPADYQIDAFDRSERRLTSGGIGLRISGRGTRMVDDLAVRPISLYDETFDGYNVGAVPDGWLSEITSGAHEPASELFATRNTLSNPAGWEAIADAPVIAHPVGLHFLRFDGERRYAAAAVRRLDVVALTMEAWVRPAELDRDNPILTLGSGATAVALGLDSGGVPALHGAIDVVADRPIRSRWTHVAATIGDGKVVLLVNGRKVADAAVSLPARLRRGAVTIGQTGTEHFAGDICEVRLWDHQRSAAAIAASRYHGWATPPAGLAARWIAGTEDDDIALSDWSGNDRTLRLGGPAHSRRPEAADPEWGWRDPGSLAPSHVVRFGSHAERIVHAPDTAPGDVPQRTVEVWFRIDDVATDRRKQVIYNEGDGAHGLVMYTYDGKLFAGGWSEPDELALGEEPWTGSWLATDRIESGRWHHAALVLDGRREVRPGSLQAFLDGRLVAAAPGTHLRNHAARFALGGADARIRFHDGVAAGTDHWLAGDVMDVRVWTTARSAADIAGGWAGEPAPDATNLELWWQFLSGIVDRTGRTPVPDVDISARVIPNAPMRPVGRESMALNANVLRRIAAVEALVERTGLAVDRLASLWGPIPHTGRRLRTPLFDQLFNEGHATRWDRSGVPAIRWDVTSTEDPIRDQAIRSRLMAGLRLSSKALDAAVAHAFSEEHVIDLDGAALDRLYRAAAVARLLRVGHADLATLLAAAGRRAVAGPHDLDALLDRIDWLETHGIAMGDFLAVARGDGAGSAPSTSAVSEMLAALRSRAADLRFTPLSFAATAGGELESSRWFEMLSRADSGVLREGVVTERLADPAALAGIAGELGLGDQDATSLRVALEVQRRAATDAVAASLGELFDEAAALVEATLPHIAGVSDSVTELVLAAASESSAIPASVDDVATTLAAVFGLARLFDLGPDDLALALAEPAALGVSSYMLPSVADLDQLARYRTLRNATAGRAAVATILTGDFPSDGAIAAVLGGSESDVASLTQALGIDTTADRLTVLERVHAAWALSQRTGAEPGLLVRLGRAALAGPDRDIADAVSAVVRSHGDEAWDGAKPARDELKVRTRDALLAVVTRNVQEFSDARDAGDVLSEYLLMDVQVGAEVLTSRLVASLAAVQLYVQRCLLNLEEGVTLTAEAARQWEWMKNYRVWEANRKVFLYPESYVEPELRDTKTPQFRELEQTLLQADVNEDAVRTALSTYVSSFVELADLKVVGSYRHKPAHGAEDEILYLVGRTRAKPWRFFVRTLRNGRTWGPWEPIALTIDSEFASPVHAFGRLFVFWSEFTKLTESVDRIVPFWWDRHGRLYPVVQDNGATQQEFDDVTAKEPRKVLVPAPGLPFRAYLYSTTTAERVQVNVDFYKPAIRFAYRQFDGTWSAPQSIDDVADKLSEVDHLQPEWQRVAVQRSEELEPATTTSPPAEHLSPDVLRVSATTELARASTVTEAAQMTWSFHVRVNDALKAGDLLGSVAPGDLKQRTLRLVAYVEKDGLVFEARNRFRRIPGIPHVPDLARAHTEAQKATKAAADLVEARKKAHEKAKGDAKKTALKALRAAEAQLKTAEGTEQQAKAALDTAKASPQWESAVDVVVRRGQSEVVAPLPYGEWHHVAAVLRRNRSRYDVELVIDGAVAKTGQLDGRPLPTREVVFVGQGNKDSEDAFVAYLSELRAWDGARSVQTINAERALRMSGKELGLFHLPLDAPLPGATMTLRSRTGLRLTKVRPPVAEIQRSKERIVMFCGDTRRLIENNLGDGGIDLRLDESLGAVSYDLDLSARAWSRSRSLSLHVITTKGVSLNDYVSDASSTLNRFSPEGLQRILEILPYLPPHIRTIIEPRIRAAFRPPEPTNRVLDGLRPAEASLIDVGNQPGWYVLDTGDESYLLQASDPATGAHLDLQTATQRLRFRYQATSTVVERQPVALRFEDDPALVAARASVPSFAFTRLTSRAPYDLQRRLFASGVADVLAPHAQASPEKPLAAYAPVAAKIASQPPDVIDFAGAHGIYYWELFFHIPFLIADTLNTEQDYAAAQRWYHFIFDPTAATVDPVEHWRFLPFRQHLVDPLDRVLDAASPALAAYRNDPFDPHAIAGMRAGAYPKAILIKYIQNLLDWADSLFSRDTGESVREALQLYFLAFNLLGPRPVERGSGHAGGIGDYATIKEAFANRPAPRRFVRDVRSDIRAMAAGDGGLPDFLTDHVFEPEQPDVGVSIGLIDNGNILTTFCVPENSELMGLWDRVEDRLHKIRHSLNIEGVARTLALFEPPLDPAALVRAVAGGAGVAGALAAGSVPVPHYRYGTMLGVAKELADSVSGLGAALAAALESRDGEQLAALVNGHEHELLGMVTAVKDAEIRGAREALEALKISKRSVELRKDRYAALVDEGLSAEEVAELILEAEAGVVRGATGLLKALEGVLGALPKVETGGSGFGGSPVLTAGFDSRTYSAPLTAAIGVADVIADVLDLTAGLVAKRGGYRRRAAEWDHELATAKLDVAEADRQIAVAQIELDNAQRSLALHRREIEHNQQVAEFHRRKFSNQELYNWMVGRLSGLHFQAYRLAHAAAKAAERALQYELPTNETFISFDNWDGLRKGLLAGESLMLDLQRMESYHLSQDSRFLEIEKSVRLSELAPGQLALLKTQGSCSFELPELLFDLDHPGHYFRVIKTIEISIEAPIAAEDTINASLVQLGSKALLDPDIGAVQYLLGDPSASHPGGDVLRVDWRAHQQIAISRVDRDDGMFVLNFFRDDRYFPFEGTGAVSQWELEMDPAANRDVDFSRIEDVVIHLRYTAKADRGDFRTAVRREVRRLTND